jgi:hypothetical protein
VGVLWSRAMRGSVVAVTAAWLAACGAEPGGEGWVAVRGDPVTLYHPQGSTVCAGTVPYLDAAAQAIAGYLRLPLPAAIPYHYADQTALPCDNVHALGCSRSIPVAIWAGYLTSVHELVHAVQIDRTGYAPSFLMEGQAVALGDATFFSPPRVEATDDQLLRDPYLPGEYYGTVGDLVSYLLSTSGPAAFEQLIAGLPFDAPRPDLQAAFIRVYGQDLAAVRRARLQSPLRFPENRLWLTECEGLPPGPLPGEGEPYEHALSCGADAIGPINGSMSQLRTFDVEAAGLYSFAPQVPTGGSMLLHHCGNQTSVATSADRRLRPDHARIVANLPQGRYVLGLGAPVSERPAPFRAAFTALPAAPAGDCPAGVPLVSVAADDSYLYLLSMERRSFGVSFRVDRPRTMAGVALVNSLGSGALVCTPACSSSCEEALAIKAVHLSPDVTYSVHGDFDGSGEPVGLRFF